MKKYLIGAGLALGLLVVLKIAYVYYTWSPALMVTRMVPEPGPDAQTIVAVSLKAIKSQNKLSPLEASYVAVVTTTETRVGGLFESKKTLIMPGIVRYEVDLGKMTDRDLTWDAKTKTLHVKLPPIEVSAPQIDMTHLTSYTDGMLTAFASVDGALDANNRAVGQQQLRDQASAQPVMARAREAASKALEQMFSMPLNAAGLKATVVVE